MGVVAIGIQAGSLSGPCGEGGVETYHHGPLGRGLCGGWSQGVGCSGQDGWTWGSDALHLAWWEGSAGRGKWGCGGHLPRVILEGVCLLEGVVRGQLGLGEPSSISCTWTACSGTRF